MSSCKSSSPVAMDKKDENENHTNAVQFVIDTWNKRVRKGELFGMSKLLPCKCGAMPEKESRKVMLGKIQDGGYTIEVGRFVCPECGAAPNWGKSYSIMFGWDKNTEVWNKFIQGGNDDEE